MDATIIVLLLKGSLMDPILWVIGTVVGWDFKRPAAMTASFLVTAGCVWGAVRAVVYVARGEELGLSGAAQIAVVCILLMLALGFAVREVRWLIKKD
jgi:hypothetical protein